MLLVVNFPAESLLACSKLTSPALSFTLGLHYLCVAAALRWYHSRETTEQLWRPSSCTVLLPAWQGQGSTRGQQQVALCRNAPLATSASSWYHLPSAHLCLILSSAPTPGWVDREQLNKRDAMAPANSNGCVPTVVAKRWQRGCYSGNWGERHKIPLRFSSHLCPSWVACCFTGEGKSQVALSQMYALYVQVKNNFEAKDPQQGLEIIEFNSHHGHNCHVSPNTVISPCFSSL